VRPPKSEREAHRHGPGRASETWTAREKPCPTLPVFIFAVVPCLVRYVRSSLQTFEVSEFGARQQSARLFLRRLAISRLAHLSQVSFRTRSR
jgi:hypothetical protein